MQFTKEDIIGLATSIGLHLLLLLLFLFFILNAPQPDPPLAEGMEIDFGVSATGMGDNNEAVPTAPNVSENITETVNRTSPAVSENIKTSAAGEESVNSKPEAKQDNQPKPSVEEPKKPSINQGALFPGKTNTGGQGNDKTPGNTGKQNGTSGGGQGGSGSNPNSVGPGGTGISIKLDGRSALALPKPRYTEQEDGTVVVKITVDRQGNVINATTDGVRGSTTTNKTLHSEAISAARKAKFNLKGDASPEQIGYITYNFMRN
jgi:TonB family protein